MKNPGSDALENIFEQEVKTETECNLICQALAIVKSQLEGAFDEKIENNIFSLTTLFQKATTNEAATYLNDKGIPLLLDIFSIMAVKQFRSGSFSNCEPMILNMFALYKNKEGLNRLAECVKNDFRNDDYLWSGILRAVSEDESKYDLIINVLNGKIPSGFLGISYLDMCNAIAIRTNSFKHPFDTKNGFAFLNAIINSSEPGGESYVVSATTSVPFLAKEYQHKVLEAVRGHKSVDIQVEAAWSGAKIGEDQSVAKLVEFASDHRYSAKAVSYLKELHLENKIPVGADTPDFQALSEMCSWLSHPGEFGAYPDQAEIFYKKSLYWPPAKDVRTIYLIKYTYKNHNTDGSDEVGVGLVGSVTFSLFGLENILSLKPIELLAIHCNWELEKEDYKNIRSGIELLKKNNKDLE